jgi:hypothetical protein
MSESGAWSVVFVGWRSKADEMAAAIQSGRVDAWTGKLHARKGARFVSLVEDGTLLAVGSVASARGNVYELSVEATAEGLPSAPSLDRVCLEALRAIPRPLLKAPISGIMVPDGQKDGVLSAKWFEDVASFGLKSLKLTAPGQAAPPASPPSQTRKAEPSAPARGDEREALLKGWIPLALQGLLEDHVRADQWELVVAYAFRALGCQVDVQGSSNPGKAVPDCIARYTSPAGQIIELVVDAKAGKWSGCVDDIRAMRDYLALSTPYSFPLFVANSLAGDVNDKLREHIMNGKTARAICGRDLALLIAQRLTDPNFNVELELRRLFL